MGAWARSGDSELIDLLPANSSQFCGTLHSPHSEHQTHIRMYVDTYCTDPLTMQRHNRAGSTFNQSVLGYSRSKYIHVYVHTYIYLYMRSIHIHIHTCMLYSDINVYTSNLCIQGHLHFSISPQVQDRRWKRINLLLHNLLLRNQEHRWRHGSSLRSSRIGWDMVAS